MLHQSPQEFLHRIHHQHLKTRLTQHYSKGTIFEHGFDAHCKRTSKQTIRSNTIILKKEPNINNLKILESLLIKEKKPIINLKDEGFVRTFNIFGTDLIYHTVFTYIYC